MVTSAPGRSASRIASDGRGATEILPENEVFGHLPRRRPDHAVGATCLGGTRPHRRDSHLGQRRFSGQTRSGRYSRARYYHPGLQRFVSEDPIGFLGGDANRYGYVANNPVRYGDPLGLDKQTKTRWECGGLASIRDYLALQVSVGPGGGVQGQFVVDRYGQIYLAFGGQIGRSPFLASGSLVQGTLVSSDVPSPTRLKSFFSGGPAFNVGAGAGGGANVVWSGDDVALEVGAFLGPQIGGGYTYGGRVVRLPFLGWECGT